MPRIYREFPFNDYYDPSKNYVQQLALPGRVAQSVEFTQMGTMFLDFMKRFGDALMRDGDIIEGLAFYKAGNSITLSPGKLYLNGLVRHTTQQVVEITGEGDEIIGAKIVETIVTELEDVNFYDPAAGSENYGQPGTYRVREDVVFTVNDPDSAPIYRFNNGEIVSSSEEKPQVSVVEDILARRTYDESGNYRVSGLEIINKNRSTDSNIELSVSEGKAYVKGYEIHKPAATTFSVPRALSTRTVLGEPKNFTEGTHSYRLINTPVAEISRVMITREITETITRGPVAGGMDKLPNDPVVTILEVKNTTKTFVRGEDYQLVNDSVDWSLLGEEPPIGTQYEVTYQYKTVLVADEDYVLDQIGDTFNMRLTGTQLPVDNSEIQIDYKFYLSRKDLICLNSVGEIVVLHGKPDIYSLIMSPLAAESDLLPLGTVSVKANSTDVMIVNHSTDRMTMETLQRVVNRVEDMELNMAITNLDKEAEAGESATELRGILTDKFIGFTKSDIHHPEYTAAMDINNGEMTLPSDTFIIGARPDGSSYDSDMGIIGNVITSPYSEVKIIEQPMASGTLLINPYAVFERFLPVTLEPSVDNWIDESTIVVQQSAVSTSQVRGWWNHRGDEWADDERRKWEAQGYKMTSSNITGTRTGNEITMTKETSKVILDEAIPFIRQRRVSVKSVGWPPHSDNIKCTFDDIPVDLTPGPPSVPGTQPGTVKADADGRVNASFMIPPGVPCGSKKVKLETVNADAEAIYTANGRKKVTQHTVLKQTVRLNVLQEVVVRTPVDPLAQTFQYDKEFTFTGLDLFFAVKDPVHAVAVQVRNVVNGYPGNICYAESILSPSDIQVSADASVATKVRFDNPVVCAADIQYAFVVMTDSNITSLYTAKLGEKQIGNDDYVRRNPYTAGVLFSSSNALTWTAHQDMDLKFNIYRAEYKGHGQIVFEDIHLSQADRILLAIDALAPTMTGIDWYYSINDGGWFPIDVYVDRDLNVVANKVSLRAEIKATPTRSPMIASETLQLVTFLNRNSATYVSRNVTLPDGYNRIRVMVDMALPTGSSAKVYYATDSVGSNWKELTNPSTFPVDEEFVRYEFNTTPSDNPTQYRVKIELSTNNPLVRPRAKRLINIMKTV